MEVMGVIKKWVIFYSVNCEDLSILKRRVWGFVNRMAEEEVGGVCCCLCEVGDPMTEVICTHGEKSG
jgi:hypothetical protein